MSIFPLPVFEADADPVHRDAMTDTEIYARLKPPKTIVIRFAALKFVAEYAYDGDAKPGCGSKLVARTHRGTELVTMLTTTCSNSGCSKSVTRQEMLEFIENSGGTDYPFHDKGRILRVATVEDLNLQAELDARKVPLTRDCRTRAAALNMDMKIVDAEPILGGELLTFYYMSEQRVDFRELVRELASVHKTRIEMRQVGARDEARLVADYERCGQHCCCKNFLKVLKPVSMRSAKTQKATLDPLKISGRCGRLMCCLRYEDQTYEELKTRLPRKGKRVGTSEGPGVVIDTKILVQLALVRLEHNSEEIAVPVEELMDPESCPAPSATARPEHRSYESDPLRGLSAKEVVDRAGGGGGGAGAGGAGRGDSRSDRPTESGDGPSKRQEEFRRRDQRPNPPGSVPSLPKSTGVPPPGGQAPSAGAPAPDESTRRKRRRRRRRGRSDRPPGPDSGGAPANEQG